MSVDFDFTDLLVNTLTVQRFTEVVSANGGVTKTWANVDGLTGVMCSRQGVGGNKDLFGAERQIDVSHTFYVNQILDVRNGDRLVDENGGLFLVQAFADQGGVDDVFAIYALRIYQ